MARWIFPIIDWSYNPKFNTFLSSIEENSVCISFGKWVIAPRVIYSVRIRYRTATLVITHSPVYHNILYTRSSKEVLPSRTTVIILPSRDDRISVCDIFSKPFYLHNTFDMSCSQPKHVTSSCVYNSVRSNRVSQFLWKRTNDEGGETGRRALSITFSIFRYN